MLGLAMMGTPAAAVPHPNAPGCPIFPANNVWHADVSSLPVHPRTGDWLSAMGGTSRALHPDFGPSGQTLPYGIPYNIVAGSHEKVSVNFYYPDESDPGPYPLGSDTTIEMGSDRHALMLDRDTCVLYEVFDTSFNGSSWSGGSGVVWNLGSNALRPAGWTSADAAGLPIFAGLIRRDEIAAGVIDHPIRLTASQTDRSYLWPARHHAGAASNPALPPMGAWFRMKSGTDISGYSAETQIIARAMKKHGMILADNGSNWYFGGAAEDGWSDTVLNELKSITAGNFEAVDVSSLMIDPNSAQIRTGPVGAATIAASPQSGVWGTSFSLTGSLRCEGTAVAGAAVSVLGAGKSATTGAGGTWATTHKPAANTTYRASWGGGGTCTGGALSGGALVIVRPGVILNVADATLAAGQTAALTGQVLPAHPGKRVTLQRFDGSRGVWISAASATLDSGSRYRFWYRNGSRGYLLFRVAYPTQDADHGWNLSRNVRIDWT